MPKAKKTPKTDELYIIGACFQGEIDAEADDPDYDLDRWAAPQYGWTTRELTDEKIAKIKKYMENEHVEAMGEDEDRESLNWIDTGWVEPKNKFDRSYRRFILKLEDEVIGMVVAQRVPTEYGFD